MGELVAGGRAQLQFAVLTAQQGFIQRIVFKDQQGIEQALSAPAGILLHFEQRRMALFAQRRIIRLQLSQPMGDGLLTIKGHRHGQGVDEQAQHTVATGQLRRAAGYGVAEHHPLLAGEPAQYSRPGRLHQGIDGQPLVTGRLTQSIAGRGIKFDRVTTECAFIRRTDGLHKTGWHLHRRQVLLPEFPGRAAILLLQPAQIIRITLWRRRQCLAVV